MRLITWVQKINLIKSSNLAVTAEFVLLIDQWFDILNSSAPYDYKKRMRNAYRGSSDQLNVLLKIISLMEKSIVSSKK